MKPNIKPEISLGAYGWHHKHWAETFYPEDLPAEDDWRLTYYSNEFNAVLVPADYWQAELEHDCENWLQSVHEHFQFFVECRSSLLDTVSLEVFSEALKKLSPQLSGLIFLDGCQLMSDDEKKPFIALADSLQVKTFDTVSSEKNDSACFAFIENKLTDLRAASAMVTQFAATLGESREATIIVNHPQLQASSLRKFREVLAVMGY